MTAEIEMLEMEARMFKGEDVCGFLEGNGYQWLHHANTASTALSYLENGRILSRYYVDSHPKLCWQTKQKSDETDKRLGIFDDIFFDVENLWERGNYFNFYGPVVFKFSIEVLNGLNVEITRDNPIRGGGGGLYFSHLQDARKACVVYNSWQFCNHIVVREAGNSVGFNFLEKIIFYSPNISLSRDHRNDPYAACDEIQEKCLANGIAFENCTVDYRHIPEYKYPIFYGFMCNVPQLN